MVWTNNTTTLLRAYKLLVMDPGFFLTNPEYSVGSFTNCLSSINSLLVLMMILLQKKVLTHYKRELSENLHRIILIKIKDKILILYLNRWHIICSHRFFFFKQTVQFKILHVVYSYSRLPCRISWHSQRHTTLRCCCFFEH